MGPSIEYHSIMGPSYVLRVKKDPYNRVHTMALSNMEQSTHDGPIIGLHSLIGLSWVEEGQTPNY